MRLVGNVLLKGMAVLFPEVYKRFVAIATETAKTTVNQSAESDITFLPRRVILINLMSFFGKHLICECKQLSCGLLLYRAGTDLALALSKTLSISGFSVLENHINDSNVNIESACEQINKKLHKESIRIVQEDAISVFDISTFDAESFISTVGAELWQIVLKITLSDREKHVGLPEQTALFHCRKLQRLYCLCFLMFCRNSAFSVPLHVLLTDVVQSYSRSTELIHTLNQFGAIASLDTHRRFVNYKVQQRED
jgi:hypothetical protein